MCTRANEQMFIKQKSEVSGGKINKLTNRTACLCACERKAGVECKSQTNSQLYWLSLLINYALMFSIYLLLSPSSDHQIISDEQKASFTAIMWNGFRAFGIIVSLWFQISSLQQFWISSSFFLLRKHIKLMVRISKAFPIYRLENHEPLRVRIKLIA